MKQIGPMEFLKSGHTGALFSQLLAYTVIPELLNTFLKIFLTKIIINGWNFKWLDVFGKLTILKVL